MSNEQLSRMFFNIALIAGFEFDSSSGCSCYRLSLVFDCCWSFACCFWTYVFQISKCHKANQKIRK